MKGLHTIMKLTLLFVAANCIVGCSSFKPVEPWEKGILSKPEMTLDGDSLDLVLTEHILSSREGASGGTGAGTGGCGCY